MQRNNDIKDRFKIVNSRLNDGDNTEDILSIWDEQKKMQEEDRKIALELKAAKKRAKNLKKQLRKNQIGESRHYININFVKLKEKIKKRIATTNSYLRRYYKHNPIRAKSYLFVGVLVVVFSTLLVTRLFTQVDDTASTLGDATQISSTAQGLPVENPDFDILYPGGEDAYDVVRISPPNNEPSYAYLDQITEGGVILRITQQQVPEVFDLQKTALEFQATNTFQVDESIVYHGFSTGGNTQSLIFVKNGILVLISSPQRFNDDIWAGYIAALR